MHRSEYWPELTAHREYWENHHNPFIYEYDSADDGPEVAVCSLFRQFPEGTKYIPIFIDSTRSLRRS